MHGNLLYIVPFHKNYFKGKQFSETGGVDIILRYKDNETEIYKISVYFQDHKISGRAKNQT